MLAGCSSGQQAETPGNSLAGKYTLVSWEDEDGDYLAHLVSEGIRPESIFIELRGDGTYTWDLSVIDMWLDKGTYKVTPDGVLTLTYSDGQDKLTMEGNMIYFSTDEDFLVFAKNAASGPAPGIGGSQTFSFTDAMNAAVPVTAKQLREYYDLNDKERLLYDQLFDGINDFEMRIGVDFNIRSETDVETLDKVIEILYSSYPAFWWTPGGAYTINGSPGSDGKYSILPTYVIDGKVLAAKFNGPDNIVYPPEEEIAAAKAWIEKGRAAIRDRLDDIPVHAGMTPFELELAVYEWLCDNVIYEKVEGMETRQGNKNAYGAIVNGKADCVGYSRSFQYIMGLLGVESLRISGFLFDGSDIVEAGAGHAWNAVKLDGEWYYSDVTNDAHYSTADNLPSHYYLNRTERFITDHDYVIGADIMGAYTLTANISCTSVKHNYYVMTDTHIASDADFKSKVPARIAIARANGERAFDMEFDWGYASVVDFDTLCQWVAGEYSESFSTYSRDGTNWFFIILK